MSARTILGSGALIGAVGVAYGVWSIITPGEDRRKEILKNLPESNPVRMEETRKRNALMMQVLKEASITNDNILARWYIETSSQPPKRPRRPDPPRSD